MDMSIEDQFAALGQPECVACGFAIMRKNLRNGNNMDLTQIVSRLPRPDYEHGIWYDPLTENLLVIRPDAEGRHHLTGFSPNLRRLR